MKKGKILMKEETRKLDMWPLAHAHELLHFSPVCCNCNSHTVTNCNILFTTKSIHMNCCIFHLSVVIVTVTQHELQYFFYY